MAPTAVASAEVLSSLPKSVGLVEQAQTRAAETVSPSVAVFLSGLLDPNHGAATSFSPDRAFNSSMQPPELFGGPIYPVSSRGPISRVANATETAPDNFSETARAELPLVTPYGPELPGNQPPLIAVPEDGEAELPGVLPGALGEDTGESSPADAVQSGRQDEQSLYWIAVALVGAQAIHQGGPSCRRPGASRRIRPSV